MRCWCVGIFASKEKANYIRERMIETVLECTSGFSDYNEDAILDGSSEIFAQAILMINMMPKREILKLPSAELGAMNIVQNCAMVNIQQCSVVDLLSQRHEDCAYKLYRWINDRKNEKGYVSKEQYDANVKLAIKIKTGMFIG